MEHDPSPDLVRAPAFNAGVAGPFAPSARTLKVLLDPPDRAQYWARVLDASEDELRQVVGEVGPRAQRVCARLWELRQQTPPVRPS